MRDPETKWAYPAFIPNEPIETYLLGSVIASSSLAFKIGDILHGLLPIQEYTFVLAEKAEKLEKVSNPNGLDEKLFLGVLGMPGLSAYSSLYGIGKPKAGETIFISSAAGAVGSLVGQLAIREGLKVIGSVGSDEKLQYIMNELGFNAGFNYKTESAAEALPRIAEERLDIYYDNVGGEQLEGALANMKMRGRISPSPFPLTLYFHSTNTKTVVSGMISQYSKPASEIYSVKNLMTIVTSQLNIQGFYWNAPDMGPKYKEEHQEKVQRWLREGSLKAKMDVTEGIENAAEGLVRMLEGRNFGKAVLKI